MAKQGLGKAGIRSRYSLFLALAKFNKALRDNILRALSSDSNPIPESLIDTVQAEALRTSYKAISDLAETRAIALLGRRDFAPLKSLIRERQALMGKHIRGSRFLYQGNIASANRLKANPDEWERFLEAIQIGRRGQDAIREVSLRSLTSAFLDGSPTDKGYRYLRENLSLLTGSKDSITLEIYPYNGKFKTYDLNYYCDLVSHTTVNEAAQVSHFEQAKEIGTRLIEYPELDPDPSDEICYRIDGKIFSLESSGTIIDGIKFPYFRDQKLGIPGLYLSAHPYCGHIARPINEKLAVKRMKAR